jgi:hypothetical protein
MQFDWTYTSDQKNLKLLFCRNSKKRWPEMEIRHHSKRIIILICLCLITFLDLGSLHAQQRLIPEPTEAEVDVQLPKRNPTRINTPAPLAPPSPHPSEIASPEWTAQEIQDAMDGCEMMLADSGAVYKHLDPLREGRCGTPAPIELSAIGKMPSVAIMPPARVTCGLAATLSFWSDSYLQQAAQKHLGETISSIRNVASYVCRNRYNSSDKPISEHARANALDMASFKTQSGKSISVLAHWALPPEDAVNAPDQSVSGVTLSSGDTPAVIPANPVQEIDRANPPSSVIPVFNPESAFLFDIHTGACSLFGTVLGPLTNAAHKNHFHYDLAERKHSNYCE